MKQNYDSIFKAIVSHEGSFGDDRRDRGNWTSGKINKGELKGTKYGISAMAYPTLDIKNLTLAKAKAIYKTDYWDKVRGDELPSGVDKITFDSAVNQGVGQASKFLQKAAGATPDGQVGNKTIRAVLNKDRAEMVIEIGALRALHYSSLRKLLTTYGLGWYRRLSSMIATSFLMAQEKQNDSTRWSLT